MHLYEHNWKIHRKQTPFLWQVHLQTGFQEESSSLYILLDYWKDLV